MLQLKPKRYRFAKAAPVLLLSLLGLYASGQTKKPNIVVIMGDDVGWYNLSCYHQGIMSGRTPNLDKLAAGGMRFTDYYAEASCTAGRANFITGEIPLRTGMTTVGQAGADVGLPAQACTMATALKAQGYATGQFGKNHLGDLNKFLPTVHGFDEFFGYLTIWTRCLILTGIHSRQMKHFITQTVREASFIVMPVLRMTRLFSHAGERLANKKS